MKALMKLQAQKGIWLTDISEPAFGPNDVLIKISKTAICGTDLHIYNWDKWASQVVPVPITIGHEFVGTVVDMGSEVTGFNIGDRVSGEGHLTCGYCRNCRAGKRHLCRNTKGIGYHCTGAFAEYLALPAFNAFKIPDKIVDDLGAILDPLGNAAHAALSFDLVGEDVLVTGAGPVGLMAAKIAMHVGARNVIITDINDYRLNIAKQLGITQTINVNQTPIEEVMQALNIREGFDVGFEMSGNETAFRDMLRTMNHGGRIALMGIPPNDISIDWNQVIFKGLILKGIYGREMFETWYKMVKMLETGLDISAVITHRFKVAEFQQAFDTIVSGESGKIILEW